MARIKGAVNAHKKRRRVFKLSKGYWGAKSKQYRAAKEQVARSLRYAYTGRKLRKRDFRRLWITRINAATRLTFLIKSTSIVCSSFANINPSTYIALPSPQSQLQQFLSASCILIG